MQSFSKLPSRIGLALVLSGIVIVSGWFSNTGRGQLNALEGRLVSIAPMLGATCGINDAPAADSLQLDPSIPVNPVTVALNLQARAVERMAALGQQGTAARAAVRLPTAAEKARVAARKPLRMIRDQYPQLSAVAVDSERNEAVMADENLFQLLVYDRTANTPARAAMTEPKRQIAGPSTYLELQCAVYIDPKTGNIYSLNNDTERHMTVFDRSAKGDTDPVWKLHTPMGSFGLAVDEEREELLITAQHEQVVAAYAKTAREEDPPKWVLWGDKTLLADPHGIALDTKLNVFYVANFGSTSSPRPARPGEDPLLVAVGRGNMIHGSGRINPTSITVYNKSARGDTAPIRVITGPNTQLNWPAGLFVDSDRGELYVANDAGQSILVFDVMANGNAAPKRVLKGPDTKISYPASVFIDLKNDEMWVANFGNHRATVYPRLASGNAKPIREIRTAPDGTPAPTLANTRIGYDSKREQILSVNCVAHPQITAFARLANGNAQSVRRIEGEKTLLARTIHSISYDPIHDEFAVAQPWAGAVLTFAGGADGEVAPIRVVMGQKPGLALSDVMTVDPKNNEYFVPAGQSSNAIHVFNRMDVGDVAPKRIIRGAGGGTPSVDYEHDFLLLSGGGGVRIFNRMVQGDRPAPLRTITGGPLSGTDGPNTPYWIPGTRNFLAATRPFGAKTFGDREGAPINYQTVEEALTFIGVWSVDDSGDAPPRYTIAHATLKEFRNFAVNEKNKEIMLSDKTQNAIYTFSFPEAWQTFAPVNNPPGPPPRGGNRN